MIVALLAALALAATTPAPVEIAAPGPQGPLAGTLIDPGPDAPLLLIIPGSGPTDRDGNNPAGVAGGPYRQLAEALAARGIATLRIDKRGMFGSRRAVENPNAATVSAYADDVETWSKMVHARTGRKCIWLLGHSEGGLVALQAARRPAGLCGVVLLSAAGRPVGGVLRDELRADPSSAPVLAAALAAVTALEGGNHIATESLPAPLQVLFAYQVQDYWIDLMAHDPAKLIAAVKLPVLILQGTRDLQVSVSDAEALKKAQPKATLTLLANVNHVLRPVETDDRAANIATYADAALPISPLVAAAVAAFVKR